MTQAKKAIKKHWKLYGQEWTSFVLSICQVFCFAIFCGAMINSADNIPIQSPSHTAAYAIATIYLMYGLCYMIRVMFLSDIYSTLTTTTLHGYLKWVGFGVLLLLVNSGLASSYEEFDDLLINSPSHVISFLVAIILVCLFVPKSAHSSAKHENHYQTTVLKEELCGETRKRTAIHEAGHALVLAAIPKSERKIHSVMARRVLNNGIRGSVIWSAFINAPSEKETKMFYSIEMMVVLAGMMAEKHLYGQHHSGVSNDLDKWYGLARLYHKAGFGALYYPTPSNKEERKTNDQAIASLKKKQQLLLIEFMILNEELIYQMVDKLIEEAILFGDEVEIFLERVIFPRGFPRFEAR